jgi:predicted glutamine amidotransferase
MCELLGLCFDAPITAEISIHEFATRGHDNPDGWGLAWYPDNSVAVIKEAIPWQSSKHTVFLESYSALRSKIFIGHVRHKTVGGPVTHADTHPFVRELDGREYCFAHNGTLLDLPRNFPLDRFRPIGSTDSEHAFCHLLAALAAEGRDLQSEDSWEWLHQKLLAMNRHGRMNFLISDGQSLVCYRDVNGHKALTWRTLENYTPNPSRLEDDELKVDLQVAPATSGIAIATCPLSGAGWQPVAAGEMFVIQSGQFAYRSEPAEIFLSATNGTAEGMRSASS